MSLTVSNKGWVVIPAELRKKYNLLPGTESVHMLEESGMRNLIREYGVTSTRSSFYTKPEKFADYAFVSSGVSVTDFKVLPDAVSDHLALEAEIV